MQPFFLQPLSLFNSCLSTLSRNRAKNKQVKKFKWDDKSQIPLSTPLPPPYPLVIRLLTFSQAVFTSATSLRASPASSLSLWASWLPFSSSHRWECCRDWSSSSSWTKKRSLGDIDAGENNVDYEADSNMTHLNLPERWVCLFLLCPPRDEQ